MIKNIECILESVSNTSGTCNLVIKSLPPTGTEERIALSIGESSIIVSAAELFEAVKLAGDQ